MVRRGELVSEERAIVLARRAAKGVLALDKVQPIGYSKRVNSLYDH